ncbi:MAG TPA: hypothetical protein VN917_10090, partial [Xanthobacteraceae bacterium]|nr:hypothetical protein [Xanthobacteraceae bacterium]
MLAAYILAVEWTRAVASAALELTFAALVLGGVALALTIAGRPADQLGLGTSRLGFRVLGGLALAAVLLLPTAARSSAAPILPASLALAAVAVSIGEELAFRGALYAALEEAGGAPLAV